jgi:formate-dependent nitrite reductase membrane component NrfD
MGPLFLASAMSSGTAAIALVLAVLRGTPASTLQRLEALEALALASKLALLLATYARLGPKLSRQLFSGQLALINPVALLGAGLSLPLILLTRALRAGGPSHRQTAVISTLVLLGSFTLRYVMIAAGRHSADDPTATFTLTEPFT